MACPIINYLIKAVGQSRCKIRHTHTLSLSLSAETAEKLIWVAWGEVCKWQRQQNNGKVSKREGDRVEQWGLYCGVEGGKLVLKVQ